MVVAVVVPIVGVALIAMILLFFYKKRKRDRENTEQRRKEVEDYRYNPNSTPLAGAPAGGHEEAGYDIGMKDTSTASSSLGYRGWGSTAKSGAVGGRKTSNMSSSAGSTMPLTPGFQDNTYREESIGEYGPVSPSFPSGSEGTVSGAPLMRTATAEGSVVAPMSGPNAFDNDGIHRGISNASSNYSTVTRSDHSDSGVPSGAQYEGQYYNADGGYDDGQNYSGHAYQQYQNGQPGGYPSPPVIRDVEARRNTRIETPTSSHFPQNANSGIAANF